MAALRLVRREAAALCAGLDTRQHQDDASDFTINGKARIAYLDWAMTYPFNLVSQCPIANLPTGFARNGIPTGIQVVAKTYDDLTVFRAAAAYERASP